MPTPPNQQHEAATPTDEQVVGQASDMIDAETAPEAVSEVAMRLNLLGKLIIPPSAT